MISPSLIMNTTKFSFTADVSKLSVLLPHLGGLKSVFSDFSYQSLAFLYKTPTTTTFASEVEILQFLSHLEMNYFSRKGR